VGSIGPGADALFSSCKSTCCDPACRLHLLASASPHICRLLVSPPTEHVRRNLLLCVGGCPNALGEIGELSARPSGRAGGRASIRWLHTRDQTATTNAGIDQNRLKGRRARTSQDLRGSRHRAAARHRRSVAHQSTTGWRKAEPFLRTAVRLKTSEAVVPQHLRPLADRRAITKPEGCPCLMAGTVVSCSSFKRSW
jgi:hypothetical protein